MDLLGRLFFAYAPSHKQEGVTPKSAWAEEPTSRVIADLASRIKSLVNDKPQELFVLWQFLTTVVERNLRYPSYVPVPHEALKTHRRERLGWIWSLSRCESIHSLTNRELASSAA